MQGPTVSEVLRSSPYRRIASSAAYLTAVVTLLDVLTTVVGLSLGGHETVGVSIAIMKAVGLAGWSGVRIGMAAFYVPLGWWFKGSWRKLPASFCFVFLVMLGVTCVAFGYPVLFNLGQLLHYL
jgi:hypothetical protein